jgi:hypothetical protein
MENTITLSNEVIASPERFGFLLEMVKLTEHTSTENMESILFYTRKLNQNKEVK